MKGKQPLDQTNGIVANTINHAAKVLKNSKLEGSILEKLWRTRQILWGTEQMLTQNCC